MHMSEARRGRDPTKSAFNILDSLVTAIDQKDKYTRQHSEDMTGYALQLVRELGCSDDVYKTVRAAGMLHDVGKIGIPASILRKPGALTDERVRDHEEPCHDLDADHPRTASPAHIIDAVANHHERWDGKGYPRGLAGEDIPLLGRIMAIADAFSR